MVNFRNDVFVKNSDSINLLFPHTYLKQLNVTQVSPSPGPGAYDMAIQYI